MEFLTSTGQKILFYFIIFTILFYLLMKYLRKKGHEYFSQSYWEGRYGYFTQQMDWYTNFTQLNKDFKIDEIIKENFYSKPHQINILELGCGNSTMSFNLYNLGYKNITAIDFSYNVINQMKKTYENTSINYVQCDFNRLNEYFNQNEFNMIIEKAGLDSIATKNSPEVPEKLVNIYVKIY
jgi:ubiquinone/menaquinone biosynthesis C-methylase UbiE